MSKKPWINLLLKVSKAKEYLQLYINGWYRLITNSGYLDKVHFDLILQNYQAQILDIQPVELQLVFSQDLQNFIDHLVVFIQYLGKYQDIVQIYYYNIFCYKILEMLFIIVQKVVGLSTFNLIPSFSCTTILYSSICKRLRE